VNGSVNTIAIAITAVVVVAFSFNLDSRIGGVEVLSAAVEPVPSVVEATGGSWCGDQTNYAFVNELEEEYAWKHGPPGALHEHADARSTMNV